MHINEQFLMKMTTEQLSQIRELAVKLDGTVTGSMSGAYTKALNDQLGRLGL